MKHTTGLKIFGFLMLAHWLEHIFQTFQVYVLHYKRHDACGMLGQAYPWLVRSEWLHFGFAVLTMVGIVLLRYGFYKKALAYWDSAMYISIWHLFEHTLLFAQAQTHHFLFGAHEPTSVLQLFFPRIELHLFYNSIVTIPIIIAMFLLWKDKSSFNNIYQRGQYEPVI